ncbi:hypothetical protein D3C73_1390180 [compost metagenome]
MDSLILMQRCLLLRMRWTWNGSLVKMDSLSIILRVLLGNRRAYIMCRMQWFSIIIQAKLCSTYARMMFIGAPQTLVGSQARLMVFLHHG